MKIFKALLFISAVAIGICAFLAVSEENNKTNYIKLNDEPDFY